MLIGIFVTENEIVNNGRTDEFFVGDFSFPEVKTLFVRFSLKRNFITAFDEIINAACSFRFDWIEW